MAEIMKAQDTITGSLGECFITIDGNRYNLMQLTNLEATITKSKTTVPILGKTGKGNKASGWEGSGSATLHYNTSLFRELMYKYVKTGQDFYFDVQITNEDPTSSVGRQTVILKDCNIDSVIIAKIDVEADYLNEDLNFTFEDIELPEMFTELPGMEA